MAIRARRAREERACLRVADPLVRIDTLSDFGPRGQGSVDAEIGEELPCGMRKG